MQVILNKSLTLFALVLWLRKISVSSGLTRALEALYRNFTTIMPGEKTRRNRGTEPVDLLPSDEVLFGCSSNMQEVRRIATRICGTNVPVLLTGSGGTGKEVLARWIHQHSPWSLGQFVKVNCAAIPGALLESELFGYEKGAFTGAHASKPGRVELAQNGTLFLDEIADLNSGLQSKLLQFLQDGRFSRIGDESERLVETRLICATIKNLEEEVEAGRFRGDLFYRINVVRLRLPRLRERAEDIPMLADYFRAQYQEKFSKKSELLSVEMLRYLQKLEWPGNIRELSNGIARHVLIGAEAKFFEEPLAKRLVPTRVSSSGVGAISLKEIAKEAVREKERRFILEALHANQWNRRRTAKALKISYRALIYKIRNANLLAQSAENLSSTREISVAPPHSSAE
jgi:two-component system, NtrC family, response regulator AtoC